VGPAWHPAGAPCGVNSSELRASFSPCRDEEVGADGNGEGGWLAMLQVRSVLLVVRLLQVQMTRGSSSSRQMVLQYCSLTPIYAP
jgi:hypothetical protein